MAGAAMAETAVVFLLENLRQLLTREVDLQTGGEEVVRWIENELERIESVDGLSNEDITGRVREVIRKAEDLAQTHTKRVIQRNNGAAYKRPIHFYRIRSITKQLYRIKDDVACGSDQLLEFVKRPEQRFTLPQDGDRQSVSVPPYLRRCIDYFQLFPPSFEVPARRLIVLWVAEGLVHSKKYDNESVEQIAERYLNELIELEVLVVKRNRSGKVKTCVIDVDRRDALLGKANFLQDRDGKIRRLVDCNGSSGDSSIRIHGNPAISHSVPNYRDVISFLSFNTQEGSKPGEDIGDFLRKCISARCFIWLSVLDLERVFRPQLPNTLGKLIVLKYLGLRWTYLEQLPDSVDRLFNLQVLDVKHTYISVLPRSIWRMEYLRHLYLSEAYRTRFPVPPSRVTLTALQTLWGAFVDEDTCVINGLDTLLNVRKLGLSCRSRSSKLDHMSKQLKAINKWISNLECLESLRLKSRDESGEAADMHLTSLVGNRKLSTVYLLGKLDPLILCKLPVSLTDITLSGSELGLDPMPFLGRLPNLVILRLLGQSVVCNNMCFPRRGFRRLKLVWIWKLEILEELEAEEGSLPCLEELEIRSCHKLEKLPDRLLQLENLEITLTSMPPEFVDGTKGKYVEVRRGLEDDQYIRFAQVTKGKYAQLD